MCSFATPVGTPIVVRTFTAVDAVDGNVSVVVTGSVDFNTVGSYDVNNTATDLAGNSSVVTDTYVVQPINYDSALTTSAIVANSSIINGNDLNISLDVIDSDCVTSVSHNVYASTDSSYVTSLESGVLVNSNDNNYSVTVTTSGLADGNYTLVVNAIGVVDGDNPDSNETITHNFRIISDNASSSTLTLLSKSDTNIVIRYSGDDVDGDRGFVLKRDNVVISDLGNEIGVNSYDCNDTGLVASTTYTYVFEFEAYNLETDSYATVVETIDVTTDVGTIVLNGTDTTTNSASIENGETIAIKLTSSSSYSTVIAVSVDVGDGSDGFSLSTKANTAPTAADATADVALGETVTYDLAPDIGDNETVDSLLTITVLTAPTKGSLSWNGNLHLLLLLPQVYLVVIVLHMRSKIHRVRLVLFKRLLLRISLRTSILNILLKT